MVVVRVVMHIKRVIGIFSLPLIAEDRGGEGKIYQILQFKMKAQSNYYEKIPRPIHYRIFSRDKERGIGCSLGGAKSIFIAIGSHMLYMASGPNV